MPDATPLAVPFTSLARKKIAAAFDGDRLTPDSGVRLLSWAERQCVVVKTLAARINDARAPAHITHTAEDVLRARIFSVLDRSVCGPHQW
jgi:hypothetical protein